MIDLIYQTEEAYWNLVYSHQNLEVKEKSLQLAKDLLKQNEIQVKVGVSAPMDILTAQAEVAARESEALQARSQIQTYEENLRRILNISQMPEAIVPERHSRCSARCRPISTNSCETALEKRPDIEQVRLDLKSKNIDVRYYRNQLLPDLQLTASYYTKGLSGTPLTWTASCPDSTARRHRGQSQRFAARCLEEPLSKTTPSACSCPSRCSTPRPRPTWSRRGSTWSSRCCTLKKTESTIYSEVKQIIMDLETNAKIVEANRISRELAEQKLAAEQKKLAVGLSTNYLVLQYQRDFSNAQIAELKSLIDYNLALSRVNKVLGTTLEKHNIEFGDFLAGK